MPTSARAAAIATSFASEPGRRWRSRVSTLEVTPPSRLVFTQVFEPTASGVQPGDQAITITVTFDERDGETRFLSRAVCPTTELRDTVIASGMESGMRETMDQLEALMASLQ